MGRKVFRLDRLYNQGESLSMDGIFPGWMDVPAMDSGFSEKLV